MAAIFRTDDDEAVRKLGAHLRRAVPYLIDREIGSVGETPVSFRVASILAEIRLLTPVFASSIYTAAMKNHLPLPLLKQRQRY
jgi:hypothetical protein